VLAAPEGFLRERQVQHEREEVDAIAPSSAAAAEDGDDAEGGE
jgi:hypothetical protein